MSDTVARRPNQDVLLLANRIATAQALDVTHATDLARTISEADDDIWDAAMQWANYDRMADEPVVAGQSPARLATRMNPSQTFTALMGLRMDPERAQSALRHFPRVPPGPQRRQ